jgi:hypothetical protein
MALLNILTLLVSTQAANYIVNGDFEGNYCANPVCVLPNATGIAPWKIYGYSKPGMVNSKYLTPASGQWSMTLNPGLPVAISQTVQLVVGQTYVLSMKVNQDSSSGPEIKTGMIGITGSDPLPFFHSSEAYGSKWIDVQAAFVAKTANTIIGVASTTNGTSGVLIDMVTLDILTADGPAGGAPNGNQNPSGSSMPTGYGDPSSNSLPAPSKTGNIAPGSNSLPAPSDAGYGLLAPGSLPIPSGTNYTPPDSLSSPSKGSNAGYAVTDSMPHPTDDMQSNMNPTDTFPSTLPSANPADCDPNAGSASAPSGGLGYSSPSSNSSPGGNYSPSGNSAPRGGLGNSASLPTSPMSYSSAPPPSGNSMPSSDLSGSLPASDSNPGYGAAYPTADTDSILSGAQTSSAWIAAVSILIAYLSYF